MEEFSPYVSVDSDELSGVTLGPGWEEHVAQLGAVLLGAWYVDKPKLNLDF